jgi:uncharacterized SAM-binding protein YcdF (DUF218 family)
MKKRRLLFFAALIFSWIFAYFFYVETKKVTATVSLAWDKRQEADCGIVLTGGQGRIREGIDLLANKSIRKLVISGVNPSSQFKQIFPMWVYYPEVEEADVILEKRSETTFGNAIQSLPLVELLSCQDVLLITSKLHMHRTLKTFKKVYPKTIEIKIHPLAGSRDPVSSWEVLQEVLKSLFYSLWAY